MTPEPLEAVLQARPRRFRPYPEYKDSGLEWVGKVPPHWKAVRVADHSDLINGFPFDSDLFSRDEGMPLVRIRDLDSEETEARYAGSIVDAAVIRNGDILIGMDGDFNVGRWRGGDALLNQRMCCLRPFPSIDGQFMFYVMPFPLKVINDLTYSTTVKHLSSDDVRKTRIPYPPVAEQRAIAAFLDRETAKIDALVARKERVSELLQEKRAALITQAVTKGLDPDVPMKDSGVEWLGEIPAHWSVERIKWVARMESGHTPDKKIAEYWQDGDIPWVSLADTAQLREIDYIADTAARTTSQGIANSSARILPPGTVVFSRDATVGLCAITFGSMAVSQHFIGWVCGERVQAEYLLFVLRSMTQELERVTMGATIRTIGMPDVRGLVTPVPPRPEQEAIVQLVLRQRSRIDALIAKIRDGIGRLKESRIALISAAVTGKIDVREGAV